MLDAQLRLAVSCPLWRLDGFDDPVGGLARKSEYNDVPAAGTAYREALCDLFLAMPEVQAKLKDLGMNAVGGSTDYANKFFASETEKWTKVIRAAHLKVD